MNSRQRLSTVLSGKIPDCVPVAPDTSNMIPARLTSKPFWDLYLYNDPPIWKAYIDCVKYFGFDSLMDGYCQINFDELGEIDHEREEYIISEKPDRIITQWAKKANGKMFWENQVIVYFIDNPPSYVSPEKINLPNIPEKWKKVEGKHIYPQGEKLLELVFNEMGEHGLVGVFCGTTQLLHNEDDIYMYYDDPNPFFERRDALLKGYEKRFEKLMSLDFKPDFICTGASGTLTTQSPAIFRELGLPIAKKITGLCKEHGIPSHVHSCGPEAELVKIMVEETDLTVIDPLEIPPMGNCNLRELKKLYGDKIVLKGNLHTTNIMLSGSVQDVVDASKQAIDEAAEGGRFILSTGDQCGRDTPDENLFAMIETARSYGRY
ncbi:MAG: hypothetical protein LBD23_01470 [Oscillospiraceae bacterium]|nr:hypothetical protein [Oscillospiraceae bacterium]